MLSEIWSQVWSLGYAIGVSQNIVAAVICLPVGFAWHHRILIKRFEERWKDESKTGTTRRVSGDDDRTDA